MGAGVTSTVRSGITNFDYFYGEEDLLMLGMFASLISAACWLGIATKWSLPVSTTQSIVGSIMGFTIVDKGMDAIYWENVRDIIIWWFATPITASIFVIILFYPIRNLLLRRKNDSYKMTIRYWPFFVFLVIFIMTIFLLEKGIQRIDIELSIGVIIAIAFAVGCIFALIGSIAFIKTGLMNKFVQMRCKEKLLHYEEVNDITSEMVVGVNKNKNKKPTNEANGDYGSLTQKEVDTFDDNDIDNDDNKDNNASNIKEQLMYGMNVDILADLSKKEENIRNEAEKFDPQCEESFAWLQVLTASFAILAHGSNDVANAVAPFAAIIGIYQVGGVASSVDVDWWVLGLGGIGMSIGLATYGYKIIKCLGARMAAMSCTRGYCIELSSATTIILASYYGQPASSTHAQVGATVGCGLLELLNPNTKLSYKDVINWTLLLQTFFGWIMTLIVSAITSAAIFSLLAYSPSPQSVCNARPTF